MTSPPEGAGTQQPYDSSATTRLRMPRHRRQRQTTRKPLPRYDYEHYSRLAGPLTQPDPDKPYTVRYRSLLSGEPHRIRAALLLGAAPLVSFGLLIWLMQPEHWTERDYPAYDFLPVLDVVMLVSIGLIELFRCMNVLSNAHATLVARDPIPVIPESGTRVAFLTSFVPGKEPLDMVTKTLEAAVKIRHRGLLHIWLLDEGDDPEVKEVCRRLGVHHFTRKGVPEWNLPKGPHRAKTKHGNYNAWLQAHGDAYDYFASVDTDHVPLANYLERMLGFFRDPDVGFVIGPQVYGNYDTFVTKAAESQQFLFHALVQRAGNRYGAPMFVGTSNAVRISALKQIGGLYDSITEDMATGFEMHRHRNPQTGKKWRSVYTPDVLAVGEGPTAWTDFFTQQLRWSRGTYETILKQFWKAPFTLPAGRLFNYSMMVIFYPMSALNWILAALSCALFLGLGASGVEIDPAVWMMLYGNASALQIGLYIWNRRHNVSPHEPEGSGGVAGMVMSALSAPIYARSLFDAVLRRKSKFVVTPKGDSSSPDTLFGTFRVHLFFLAVFGGSLVASFLLGHSHPAMVTWAVLAMLITAAPIAAWRHSLRTEARKQAAAPAEGADGTVDGARTGGSAGSGGAGLADTVVAGTVALPAGAGAGAGAAAGTGGVRRVAAHARRPADQGAKRGEDGEWSAAGDQSADRSGDGDRGSDETGEAAAARAGERADGQGTDRAADRAAAPSVSEQTMQIALGGRRT
ncbi:glycosyltransferase family 2 protein [Streptomyces kronopolitis]